MEELGNVFKALEEFLSYKIWSGDKVENIAREQIGVMKNPKPYVLFEDFGIRPYCFPSIFLSMTVMGIQK